MVFKTCCHLDCLITEIHPVIDQLCAKHMLKSILTAYSDENREEVMKPSRHLVLDADFKEQALSAIGHMNRLVNDILIGPQKDKVESLKHKI